MPDVSAEPQLTSNQKSINWKRVLIITMIAVVVIGLGEIVYRILQPKPNEPTQIITKKATPSAKIATPSVEKKEQETNLTESYTDSFYKVTFNYPDNWEEKTKSGIEACEPSVGPNNVGNSGLSICEFGLSSVDDIASLPGESASMKKSITVSGKNAIRQVVTENGEDKAYAYIGNVNFNGQVGTLTIIGWLKGTGLTTSEFMDLFDQILSTFKFLD